MAEVVQGDGRTQEDQHGDAVINFFKPANLDYSFHGSI